MFRKKTGASDKGSTTLVQGQNHEELIKSVQELSVMTQKPKPLPTVTETGKFFGLGSHKVTGKELNTALSQIYGEMIHSKQFDAAVLDHITAVYEALNALDASHISGILQVADATKVADDKANINGQNIEKLITLQRNNAQYAAQINEMIETMSAMENKVKTAYYIAGGSIGIAIFTLLLSLSGIF